MSNVINLNPCSEKKTKMISEFNNKPFELGEEIKVPHSQFSQWSTDNKFNFEIRKILELSEDGKSARVNGRYGYNKGDIWAALSVCQKFVRNVGMNPFAAKNWHSICQNVNFTLESIIFQLYRDREAYKISETESVEIPSTNWNPYVIDKDGNKQFYQRDFVWTLEDKQKLIESIYNYIECGKIVIRKHSVRKVFENWRTGDKSMCFFDIVDGKQRLNAVIGFINNEYPDLHGNYYSDLSDLAQDEFLDHQLFSYAEIGENATDEDVIRTFLMINFTGVQMSQSHIDYVKEIYNKI